MSKKQINWPFWIVAQAKSGIPLALGTPGVGKTAIGRLAAEVFKRDFIQYLIASSQPEELNGIPMPGEIVINGETHPCIKTVHTETYQRAVNGHCFVLLDEINHANKPKQAAVQDTWLNNPPEAAIVAAVANPKEIATDGHEFSAPVTNRLWVGKWENDLDTWLDGMAADKFAAPSIPILPEDFSGLRKKWKGYISMFAREPGHRDYFDWDKTFPKDPKDQAKPWCSPRSWENCATNLAACEAVEGSHDTARKIMQGFVGEAPTISFFSWFDSLGMPSTAQLYEDPNLLRLPRRFDIAVSIVQSVLQHTHDKINEAGDKHDKGLAWEKGMRFLDKARIQGPEIAEASAKHFAQLKPKGHVAGSIEPVELAGAV